MTDEVTRLAALIREVDGSHTLGAASLAEALIGRGVGLADVPPDGAEPVRDETQR